MSKYFITGISTAVGKTIVSAILAKALSAHYWKPIQAGIEPETDSQLVRRLTKNTVPILPEYEILRTAASPDYAAALESKNIRWQDALKCHDLKKIENLVLEGAGGILVPLNNSELMLDILNHDNFDVILVIRNYLGSINHSLLTLEVLRARGIVPKYLIVTGDSNSASERSIEKHSKLEIAFRIPVATELNSEFIFYQAALLKQHILKNS